MSLAGQMVGRPQTLRPLGKRKGMQNGKTLLPGFLAKGAVEGPWFWEGHNLIESLCTFFFLLYGYREREEEKMISILFSLLNNKSSNCGKKYLVDYRNLIKKPKQLSLIVDDLTGLYYCHTLNFYLSGQKCGLGKDDSYCQLFQLPQLDGISGCVSEYRS